MESSGDQSKENWDGRSKRKKEEEKREEKKKKLKESKTIDIKKVAEEWEIWDEKEEVARSENEAKNLVPE